MIESNGGWDSSIDKIVKALDTLDYYLNKGVIIILFDKETGKGNQLKPFNRESSFIMPVKGEYYD